MTGVLEDPRTAARGRRRRWIWVAVALGVALVVFVLVWFQPQKLYIDERVEEAAPTGQPPPSTAEPSGSASSASSPGPPAAAVPDGPAVIAAGEFVSRDHGTAGTVSVLEVAAGSTVVRLEELDTDNGPDLYLYLSANPASGDEDAFDDDYLNLGRLKGNLGDQNYELPAGADLSRYRSVVIWCDRFDSAFGAADLVPQ